MTRNCEIVEKEIALEKVKIERREREIKWKQDLIRRKKKKKKVDTEKVRREQVEIGKVDGEKMWNE